MKVDLDGYKKVSLLELPLWNYWGNIEERNKQVKTLLLPILNQYSNPKILDLAMGSGADTIPLLKDNYDVTSNEIDETGYSKAVEDAQSLRLNLNLKKVNWRDFLKSNQYLDEEFDILFSLGNSFPNYLLEENDRLTSLRGFWRILKKGGTLVFDSRNFDYMLNNKDYILVDPEGNFNYSYSSTYLGRDVKVFPTEIKGDKIHLVWKNLKLKNYSEMDVWPATINNVREMVIKAIGDIQIDIYYDFSPEKPASYDFVQFVLRK